jgi:hypothetical protein
MGDAMRDMQMMTSEEELKYNPPTFDAQGNIINAPTQQQLMMQQPIAMPQAPQQGTQMPVMQNGQPMSPQQYYEMLQKQRQMQQGTGASSSEGSYQFNAPQNQTPSFLP